MKGRNFLEWSFSQRSRTKLVTKALILPASSIFIHFILPISFLIHKLSLSSCFFCEPYGFDAFRVAVTDFSIVSGQLIVSSSWEQFLRYFLCVLRSHAVHIRLGSFRPDSPYFFSLNPYLSIQICSAFPSSVHKSRPVVRAFNIDSISSAQSLDTYDSRKNYFVSFVTPVHSKKQQAFLNEVIQFS